MASQTVASAQPRLAVPGLAGALVPISVGLVGLGLLFHVEIAAAVRVWLDSTAYNHCFLVIPIVAYLLWDRRETLGAVAARPIPLLALAALPLSAAWLVAERIGFMEGRQLVAMTSVELLLLAVLGWRTFWMLSGPLLYLYFLVPFGDFLTPALQDFTAFFVMHGLDWLGIANYTDGYVIQIPEGTFFIAEACAGLRFLIASIAFGCLYSLLIYRTPGRRLGFIVASLIVPIIANGFRALGIVVLGHVLGSAQAAETDHILYGWIFFSIVILILVAIGLPFRQDQIVAASTRPAPPPSPRAPIVATVALLLLLTAFGPATAFALTRAAGQQVAVFDLGGSARCVLVPPGASAAEASRIVVLGHVLGSAQAAE
ncbi:MAG: exosortase A, partial [Acetobacteraceae bacterium]